MPVKSKAVTYDTQYKRKLNMLGPGTIMLRISGLLALVGIAFLTLKQNIVACIAFALAVAVFVALFILIFVELHQDKALNKLAERENKDYEK